MQVLAVAAAMIGSNWSSKAADDGIPLIRDDDDDDTSNAPSATPDAGRDASYIDVSEPADDDGAGGQWGHTTNTYNNPNFTTNDNTSNTDTQAPMGGSGGPTDSTTEEANDTTNAPNDSATTSPGASPEPSDMDATQVHVTTF
jgi:hypothetical protein